MTSTRLRAQIPASEHVLALIIRLAPRPWNPTLFMDVLTEHRNRPIVLCRVSMPADLETAAMITRRADYIFVPDMSPSQHRTTIHMHGIIHILLAHRQLNAQILLSDTQQVSGPTCGYPAADELEAERLAELFVAQLEFVWPTESIDGAPAGAD